MTFSGAVRIAGRRAPARAHLRRHAACPAAASASAASGASRAPLVVRGAGDGVRLHGRAMNGVSDGRYRGAVEISPAGPRGLRAVNALPIDTYVRGVVAGEMPSSWDLEALKAQAVVARSYALTTDAGGDLFDQYPDTRSQVYRGAVGETTRTNSAVAGDRRRGPDLPRRGRDDLLLTRPPAARTESVEHGFPGGGARSATCAPSRTRPTASRPNYRWTERFTPAPMQRRLQRPRPRAGCARSAS